MKKSLIIFVVFNCLTSSLYSQNKTVHGRVISTQFDGLIGVPIMIDDTILVGSTDLNGFFQIDIPVSVNQITFTYVGLETTAIELADTCDEVEIVMMLASSYDFITLNKADRLRMKRFKKLPEFHREAFKKGLFKTNKACYSQEFIPVVRKKES